MGGIFVSSLPLVNSGTPSTGRHVPLLEGVAQLCCDEGGLGRLRPWRSALSAIAIATLGAAAAIANAAGA